MKEILKRESNALSEDCHIMDLNSQENHEEISDENEDSGDDLQVRFKDLNLDNEDISADEIWSRLTLKEKRDFNRFITSNNIIHFIPTWTPWWLEKKSVIVEINQQNSQVNESLDLPAFKSLNQLLPSGISPHHSVGFVLADVLLGYTFIMRFYNGDCMQLIDDAGTLLCSIITSFAQSKSKIPSLLPSNKSDIDPSEYQKKTRIIRRNTNSTKQIYNSIADILGVLQYKLMELNLPCHPSIMILLLEDISHLLDNIAYCTRALEDTHKLLVKFRKVIHKNSASITDDIQVRARNAHHKLVFLRSCLDQNNEVARHWQLIVLPKLWNQISTELVQRIHDIEDFTGNTNHHNKSAGPNWRNIIRNGKNDDKKSYHALIESLDVDD
ncbi:unnamed protein product [Heterobilharzia americana]|nr:unnamed protein product [Heterobilharzia americana]